MMVNEQLWTQMMGTVSGGSPYDIEAANEMSPLVQQQLMNTIGTPTLAQVPFPAVDPTILPQETPIQQAPVGGGMNMSQKSFDKFSKGQGREEKRTMSDREKMEQQIRDYMSKREQIAIDTENRMAKLDAQQAAKGPNLSALMAFGDSLAQGSTMAGGPALSQMYAQSGQAPLSDVELMNMKQKLQGVAGKNYEGLTKDQMNLLRQEDTVNYWDDTLKAKLATTAGKSDIKPFGGEMVKRLDNIVGMDKALGKMEKLTRSGQDQPVKTYLGQNTSLTPDTEFGVLLRNAAEFYGRMQSGGAIQQKEGERFIMSMFKPTESKERKLFKLNQMKQMIKDRARSLAYGRDVETLPPALKTIVQGGSESDPSVYTPEMLSGMTREQKLQILRGK